MSVEDRLRRGREKLQAAAREQQDQRALRERHVAEAQQKSKAGFQKQMDTAMQYAKHMDELNKRQQAAKGWATEKTMTTKDHVMGFGAGTEEAEPKPEVKDPFGRRPASAPVPVAPAEPVPPQQPAQQQRKYSPAVAPSPPDSAAAGTQQRKHSRSVAPRDPVAEQEPERPAPPPRRARHRREESFDDDDFSNNSWLK
jgi:hypothetical protein